MYNPSKKLQRLTNIVGFTLSVGDTVPRFSISIEPRQLELVTLNIIEVEAFLTNKNKRVCICLGGEIVGGYFPCKEKQIIRRMQKQNKTKFMNMEIASIIEAL
jgi:hypothetical protein